MSELFGGPSQQVLNVLDLFAGKGGWSKAFRDRGHMVTRVELDPACEPEICGDILTMTAEDFAGDYDLILASPPCEKFSIMAVSHYWEPVEMGFLPKNPAALLNTQLAMHALYLIQALAPRAAIMENPRGLMRKILPVKPERTVWYCQYGDTRAKPTDLWLFGGARQFYFKPECKNKRTGAAPALGCHHEASPRGARTGTQTPMSYHDRSLIPYGLSLAVCEQMEAYVAGELVPGRLAV